MELVQGLWQEASDGVSERLTQVVETQNAGLVAQLLQKRDEGTPCPLALLFWSIGGADGVTVLGHIDEGGCADSGSSSRWGIGLVAQVHIIWISVLHSNSCQLAGVEALETSLLGQISEGGSFDTDIGDPDFATRPAQLA